MSYPEHRPGAGNDIAAGRRIVVGVDGSAASVAALAWAAREARLRQAELVAVYAWEDAERCRAPYAARRGLSSRAKAQSAALLSASVRAVFGRVPPPGLRAEVADGRPEQVLPGWAVGAEMLVLGRSRWDGDFLAAPGPVHRACLHSASCPVTIVGCPAAPAPDRRSGVGQPRKESMPGAPPGLPMRSRPAGAAREAPAGQSRVPSVTARS